MSTDQAIAFFLFAIVAAITPGPSNILLTSVGANVGVWRGLPSLFGVTLGMGFMLFVVAFGLGSLVLESPTILRAIKWCGIGFLLWLSWKIATSRHLHSKRENNAIGFWRAAAFQWVNPKSWLICASAAGAYLHAGTSSAFTQAASFALVFVLAAVPSCAPWLVFGATLQRFLRSDRALRMFNIAMGTLLLGSILLFVK